MLPSLPPAAGISHTVYGVVLNHPGSLSAMGASLNEAPYQAPPKAPVLYIKPCNTWAQSGASVSLPTGAGSVEIGATLGLLIGSPASRLSEDKALQHVAAYQLVIDLSLPHSSYYRPAIREKCFDGSCVLGPEQATKPALETLGIQTLINGQAVDTWAVSELLRQPAQLLAQISAFMTLNPGDRLLVGVKWQAPQAKRGDVVVVQAQGLPTVQCTIGGQA
ncbi:fumarylacetoacetate hydrolase family protein [Pusillimonas sp. CC-YST705]|uniref:Fumarylacetoacetate hydrolase family protein n=1 Tax=Mesopusillimonas faecipullorum TaxID=2755040 RepID=A0ABS8CE27_9BURK|nr:fumarylacetoacetate hydrolase family protein [Mesopusillimonas faecipullorum]MCB5363834.1 fumarylacetoacetate hydrolase family protein [Mesopusillimonas faecipullorum]